VSTGQTPARALTTGVVGSHTVILPFTKPVRALSATPIKALNAEPISPLSAELMGINGAMLPAGGSQLYASNTSAGLLMRRALHLARANNLKVREPYLQAEQSAGNLWLQIHTES
jgi:hypothetical protein